VGVLFYPSGGIATIGLGASLTVFLCAATNLMLTPSLISTFPGSQLVSVSQLMQPEIHWLRHASGRAVPLQDGLRRLSDW